MSTEETKPIIITTIDGVEFQPINKHTDRKLVKPLSGRMFREAYKAPNDENVIQLNMAKVGEIVHGIRRAWRGWKEFQPFTYDGDTFDADERSLKRIERLISMSEKNIALPKSFTSATGKEHPITPEWLFGLYEASVQHNVAAHEASKKLKVTIDKHIKGKKEMLLKKVAEKLSKDMKMDVEE